jgi:hypothetical protein
LIKAIETRYKGYRFRSRLEARWAVFFDSLGIEWEYEPEGFELPSGFYLPDFLIRSHVEQGPYNTFVEIKGQTPDQRELAMCDELSKQSGACVLLYNGDPLKHREWRFGPKAKFKGEQADSSIVFDVWVMSGFSGDMSSWDQPVVNAATDARSARFEHGECGLVAA